MDTPNTEYVRVCWLRGRVPERLHRWWHFRHMGRGAWKHSRHLVAPCRITHDDMDRARRRLADLGYAHNDGPAGGPQ